MHVQVHEVNHTTIYDTHSSLGFSSSVINVHELKNNLHLQLILTINDNYVL